MKFNATKLKDISRPMTESERQEIEYREENRTWLALSSRFALKVRKILREKSMTQTELASRMGVSSAQVAKILSGKENLGLHTICRVEKALNENIIEIMDSEKSPQPNPLSGIVSFPIAIPQELVGENANFLLTLQRLR